MTAFLSYLSSLFHLFSEEIQDLEELLTSIESDTVEVNGTIEKAKQNFDNVLEDVGAIENSLDKVL